MGKLFPDLDLSQSYEGEFPASPGTAIALDGFVTLQPEHHGELAPIDTVHVFYINLKTLFRNCYKSEGGEVPSQAKLIKNFIRDLNWVNDVIQHYGKDVEIIPYVADYKNIHARFPLARVRGDTTDKQKLFTFNMNSILRETYPSVKEAYNLQIFSKEFKPTSDKKAAILTGYPIDLCSHKKSKEMYLLESHTGKVKKSYDFYTKFLNGKELEMIPFCLGFLQIFGDKESFFPRPKKFRETIVELATEHNWTQYTGRIKIMDDLKFIKDLYIQNETRKILM